LQTWVDLPFLKKDKLYLITIDIDLIFQDTSRYPTQGNTVSYKGFEKRDELHASVKHAIKATVHGEEPL
jgi:hypothetical protein